MVPAFLAVNAALYLALALWCTIAPDTTSRAIGFVLSNGSARSEYLTVYGGLELGMGIFFAVTAFVPDMRSAGLLFALLTYASLAVYRLVTVLSLDDVGRFPWAMLALESTMAVLAVLLIWRSA